MKPEVLYRYWVMDPIKKKPRLTRYVLTPEEAAKRYPGAKPDLASKEVRMVPETEEEMHPPSLHSTIKRSTSKD